MGWTFFVVSMLIFVEFSTKCSNAQEIPNEDDIRSNEECDKQFYLCASSREIIPWEKVCDGTNDCPYNDDEEQCPYCSGYECDYFGTCIPVDWLNDGIYDCPLKDDEADVAGWPTPYPYVTEEPAYVITLIKDFVLSDTILSNVVKSNDLIEGQFSVGNIDYSFSVFSNSISKIMVFTSETSSDNDYKYDSFRLITNAAEDIFQMLLYKGTEVVNTIVMKEQDSDSIDSEAEDGVILETFFNDFLAYHFVQLSLKLGSLGYLGSNSEGYPVKPIHLFASWIYRFIVDDDIFDDLSDEIEKVNSIVLASENAGFWIENTDQLKQYSDTSVSLTSARRLQDGCELSDQCDNECYGRCGRNCECWAWICGTCDCISDCQEHDSYCSCETLFHYWCINVFWITCD